MYVYSDNSSFNSTKMLDNYQGFGAYSTVKFECIHLPNVIESLREEFNITTVYCAAIMTNLNMYNTLVASPILSLLATPLLVDNTKHQRDYDKPLTRLVNNRLTAEQII